MPGLHSEFQKEVSRRFDELFQLAKRYIKPVITPQQWSLKTVEKVERKTKRFSINTTSSDTSDGYETSLTNASGMSPPKTKQDTQVKFLLKLIQCKNKAEDQYEKSYRADHKVEFDSISGAVQRILRKRSEQRRNKSAKRVDLRKVVDKYIVKLGRKCEKRKIKFQRKGKMKDRDVHQGLTSAVQILSRVRQES